MPYAYRAGAVSKSKIILLNTIVAIPLATKEQAQVVPAAVIHTNTFTRIGQAVFIATILKLQFIKLIVAAKAEILPKSPMTMPA
jgi:hypothetical protein